MGLGKKLISGVVAVAFAFSAVTPAFAQPEPINQDENAPQVVMMDASDFDGSVPDELAGMDRFLTKDAEGCIQLDVDAALAAGYLDKSVFGVKEHLDKINEEVTAGRMVVDETFTARSIDLVESEIAPLDIEWTSTGYTGIETKWTGDTFIYYNVAQANCLWRACYNVSEQAGNLLINLNQMSGDPDANKAYALTVTAVDIIYWTTVIYKNAIGNAKAAGTGIIWFIHQDFTTGAVGSAFGAQDWDAI